MGEQKSRDTERFESTSAAGELSAPDPLSPPPETTNDRLETSSADRKVVRMGTASIPGLITEFAIPSVVAMLVNGSYNLIDSIFLGNAVGEIGLSTITVATPIMIFFMAMAMLIGNGGNALAALQLGQGNRKSAEVTLGNVVTLCIILWIIVFILTSIPPVLNALLTLSSSTDEVRAQAGIFIRILGGGFVLQLIGMGVNNFIRTSGSPYIALLTMVIGLGGATFFNFLFVIVLGWGVPGSAIATITGQALSCASVLSYFLFKKNIPLRLRLSCMKPDLRTIGTTLVYGLPSFTVQAGMSISSLELNTQLVVYGAQSTIGSQDALASIGVVQRIGMFTAMPLIGISIAIQPLLGYNYGAFLIDRVKRILWMGIGCAVSIAVLEWLIIMFFPDPIVNAFGITNADLESFTSFALRIQFLVLPLVGFQIVGSNYFQATGQPLKSIFLSLLRQILFLIPLLYFLPTVLPQIAPQYIALDALYFATPISDSLAILFTAGFIIWEMHRLKLIQEGKLTTKYEKSPAKG
ncbi:MAG: MATE family efflux transporter [Eggerthellaceae bacterium]|nr:MATE family efflux transporter [Eggerthellaceae bacterium]